MSENDYLWDKSGEADPDVQRLENLLAPFAHDPGAARVPAIPRRTPRAPRWIAVVGGAAAAAAVVLFVLPPREPVPHRPPAAPGPVLEVVGPGRHLAEESWIESGGEQAELRLGDVGRITLAPQSRLQVRRLGADETRLFLAQGELEATVSADAHPRFFQVDTPAARCVDLGCRYTLTVDDAGDAYVRVVTGQVAFENHGREVYVPAGATCRATRADGAGTPRFERTDSVLVARLDAYDAAARLPPGERRRRAESVLVTAATAYDTLPLWHLLQDPDEEIARRARARLTELAGALEPAVPDERVRPDAAERARWKERFARDWR
jgi:hypothetical protein